MPKLVEMVRAATAIDEIETFLNDLPHSERQAEVEALNGADLGLLYTLADSRHVEIDFFVPSDRAAGTEVVHHGRNSLPVIGGTFRKRFTRIAGDEELIGGYNDNDGIVAQVGWFTGPGYFVIRPRGCANPDGRGDTEQLFVNYYEVPESGSKPVDGWPAVAGNTGLTSGLVFGKMCDYMWRVSGHVSIGQAWKKGKCMGQHFALVREDGAS